MAPNIAHLSYPIIATHKNATENGFKNSKTHFLKDRLGNIFFVPLLPATASFSTEAAYMSESIPKHRSVCARASK